jgi:hypothetical protein
MDAYVMAKAIYAFGKKPEIFTGYKPYKPFRPIWEPYHPT